MSAINHPVYVRQEVRKLYIVLLVVFIPIFASASVCFLGFSVVGPSYEYYLKSGNVYAGKSWQFRLGSNLPSFCQKILASVAYPCSKFAEWTMSKRLSNDDPQKIELIAAVNEYAKHDEIKSICKAVFFDNQPNSKYVMTLYDYNGNSVDTVWPFESKNAGNNK